MDASSAETVSTMLYGSLVRVRNAMYLHCIALDSPARGSFDYEVRALIHGHSLPTLTHALLGCR